MASINSAGRTRPGAGSHPAPGRVPTIRELAAGRGPRRWFTAAGISSLVLVASSGWGVSGAGQPAWVNALFWCHLLGFVGMFMVGPPLGWYRSGWFKAMLAVAFFALSLGFFAYPDPSLGSTWLWTYVAVFVASQGHPRTLAFGAVAALAAASFAVNISASQSLANSLSQAVTIASLGMMMMAFSRQMATIRELRQTKQELAELAVREERRRVARDMHDILGHTLTVISLKAELAGRLLQADPGRAATEVAELEGLARGALEDVRSTVAGYRGVNILSELASARTALAAAGIDADLPGAADTVPAVSRELFGWALREGVTNVIRHGSASGCRVALGAAFLQIDDDGVGPGSPVTGTGRARTTGSGLNGLRARAEAAGATLELGRSELGGFKLRLQL